ncbi:MAG: metal ABC transporter permease [Methanoregulaceae archaeon]|nr:metal ABC transporter permease [Methanoregulaceae archaeon]
MMLGILGFEFFRNAVIAGLIASIVCGIIGSFIIVKRLVSLSGGLAHTAFGGIGLGYFLGIDPFLGAAGFTVGSALLIGTIREKFGQYMETLTGVVWAAGMAIGILFIALTPGYAPELFGFLFGNILLIPSEDLVIMGILALVILGIVTAGFNQLIAVTFDEEYARVMNLPVTSLLLLLLLLIAISVVILLRVVGIILVIALLTIPPAIAREYTSSMRSMMCLSVLAAAVCTIGGLFLSYTMNVPSGATIILLATGGYGIMLLERWVTGRREQSAAG